jgi:penicillin-insensitive murein endopeptidase
MYRVALWVSCALVLGLGTVSIAEGDDDAPETASEAASASGRARSVGWVWRGLLERGVFLSESSRVHHVARFAEHERFWGTDGLVALLRSAAQHVWDRAPGARLNVGELSQRGGGNVVGHRSHENGRDVDVGFYLVDEAEKPVEAPHFVRISSAGRGFLGEGPVFFDVERNWALVEALVSSTETPVQLIFVAPRIRRKLLRHARNVGADPELVERAEWVMLPPEGVARHDDHFHVRIYCDPSDGEACVDRGPFWAWIPPEHVPEGEERAPRFLRHARR